MILERPAKPRLATPLGPRSRPGRSLLAALAGALLTVAVGCGGRVEPATTPAQLDFGVEMAERGLWSEALFRFRQAHQLNPDDARILNNMAVAYEALGEFDQALDSYRDAIRADPTNRDLRRNYSRFVEFYRAFRPEEQADAAENADG